ncbi:MAG TPA: hypothetical protein V8P47_01015 [Candidatus Azosocius sp. HAIN]
MKYKYNDFLNQYNLYIDSYNNLVNNKLLLDKFFLFFLASFCIILLSIKNIKYIESIFILISIIYIWFIISKQFYIRIKTKMKIIINMEDKLIGYKPFYEEIKLLKKIQEYKDNINNMDNKIKWNNYKNIIDNLIYYKNLFFKILNNNYKIFTKKDEEDINYIYSTYNIKITFLLLILLYSIIKLIF